MAAPVLGAMPPNRPVAGLKRNPTPDELLKAIKPNLSALMAERVRVSVDVDKIWQYAQLRRNHLYYRGKQNLILSTSSLGDGYVDYKPVTQGQNLQPSDRLLDNYYDSVLNVLRGDVRALVAVLGARSPNTEALALDPSNETHYERQRIAQRVAQFVRGSHNWDDFHRHLCFGLSIQGTQFSYCRYISDASKYGFTEVPQYDLVYVPQGEGYYQCPYCGQETPQSTANSLGAPNPLSGGMPPATCMQCGRPLGEESLVAAPTYPAVTQTTPLQFPNGGVEVTLCGGDTVTVPFGTKKTDLTDATFLLYECEIDPGAVLQAYPELREKFYEGQLAMGSAVGSTAAAENARQTRLLFASPTGYISLQKRKQWLWSKCFYPPTAYEAFPNDRDGKIREILYHMFPRGLEVTYVQGEPVRLQHTEIARKWTACKPEPSETIYADPYFEDYIEGSNTINDMLNMIVESAERSVPLTIFDPNYIDPDRIREYAGIPGELIPASQGATGDFSKAFFTIRPAELPAAAIQFIDKYVEWLRGTSGITPTLWGAIDDPTAHGTEIRRNQALGRLNTLWSHIREFEAATQENAVCQYAIYSNGRLASSKGDPDSSHVINVPNIKILLKGGWRLWAEEAMPMTPGQRRDWAMNLIQQTAGGAAPMSGALGLMEPSNFKRLQETVGQQDWKIPGERERSLITKLLSDLSSLPPLPAQPIMDPMSGQLVPGGPPQVNSPIPVEDLFFLDPQLVIKVSQEWMVGDAGQQVMETDYQGGWQNALAWLRQWQMLAMPPPMPGGEGGPPPEDGGDQKPDSKGPPPHKPKSQPGDNPSALAPAAPGPPGMVAPPPGGPGAAGPSTVQ
jgi:hypothetical protein